MSRVMPHLKKDLQHKYIHLLLDWGYRSEFPIERTWDLWRHPTETQRAKGR